MKEFSIQKHNKYVRENNPVTLLTLEERRKIPVYLIEKFLSFNSLLKNLHSKPGYIIEQTCLRSLQKICFHSKSIASKIFYRKKLKKTLKYFLNQAQSCLKHDDQ